MKSIFKRSLSIFMAIIMLCSVMTVAGVSAFATEEGGEVSSSETTASESVSSETESSSQQESSSSEVSSEVPESSSSQQESQESQPTSSQPSESEEPSEETPSDSTVFKGVDVTFKSAQGLFDDFTKTYQQGEVFEIAINWRSNDKITGYEIDTLFDCEGLEVISQTVNTKAKGQGNIDKESQRDYNLVSINYSKYNGVVWNTMDYIVKYEIKVLSEVGTKQTMTVNFKNVTFVVPSNGDYENPKWDYSGDYDFSYIETDVQDEMYKDTGRVVEEFKEQCAASVDASEPATPVKKYTIVGNINGKDVGFDKDAETVISDYNFVDGVVTIPCTRDSYVFVKTVNTVPTEWFMFNKYTEDTSGTLYNTSTGSTEKMKVPAGYVTFTLTENQDGSINLSYEADTTNIPTEPYIPNEYTIVGNINGEDMGFDSDAQTFIPAYNFVDGTVAIEFNQESYVFVKTTDNEHWYMSEGYCAESSCVMYDTTATKLADANKMYVPAGRAIFTLVENEDGTISLSYEMDASYVPPLVDKEYTVVGKINGADVGCESDYENSVQAYTFVNGNVTIEFTEESYIFVKTTDNKNWYMFTKYIGDATTGTMYNTKTGTKEKMRIPAGKYTLILSETGKDKLRLTYVPYVEPTEPTPSESTQPTTAPTKPTEPKPTEPKPTQAETVKSVKAGGSEKAVNKFITSYKKETDLKGSVYEKLQVKSKKATKTSVSIKWNKVKGAKKYVVYGAKCGSDKYKKLKTTTSTAYTQKKLKKDTYYRYMVVAVNSKGKVVTASKTVHIATKYKKVGNHKAVKVASTKVVLKYSKQYNLKAKGVAESKKLKVKKHNGIRYVSTNTKIATVTSNGVIKTQKKKGTCYVYAYAQNGVAKKVKVIVKK